MAIKVAQKPPPNLKHNDKPPNSTATKASMSKPPLSSTFMTT
eukprot:CAMPEP_0114637818 /NCGR_PEP_ID=MMETSP0191-20121206/295_1 /TAXON_ID=126664 /ORGANISM="Sorites sp." /LENGTH=41 /DNA_ID= /DNA_START= /DNA_END= /DNA_ORIENTATION=